ncbi:sensor histidine kinase [Novosphingobium lindaniclasticum]
MPMAERTPNREGPARHAAPLPGSGEAWPEAALEAEESDHRIANNLQLLMAMIAAEKREVSDPAAGLALDRMLGRIGAIAGVHRQLTRTAEAGAGAGAGAASAVVDIGGYLRTLARQIEAGCCDAAAGRRLRVRSDAVLVPARLAAAMGLIASECVLNACKYAYAAQAPGEVRIGLSLAGPHALRLTVEDDGAGHGGALPSAGFGARLIAMLAARIGAALVWEDARPGTRVVLAVPLA